MRRPMALLLTLLYVLPLCAQTPIDADLLAEINRIKAIDNHAHVMAVAGPGEAEDADYDAISCGGLEFV